MLAGSNVCVCSNVRVFVQMCVCVRRCVFCVCKYVCVQARVCACVCVFKSVWLFVCKKVCLCTCARVRTSACVFRVVCSSPTPTPTLSPPRSPDQTSPRTPRPSTTPIHNQQRHDEHHRHAPIITNTKHASVAYFVGFQSFAFLTITTIR